MLQTKRKIAAVIAAVATIFSALVVSSPAQAAVPNRPTISSVTLNDTILRINVASDSGLTVRDELVYEYKKSTESSYAHTETDSVNGAAQYHEFTVAAGFSYDVRVLAKNAGDVSGWRTASATVPSAPVSAPTITTDSSGDIHVSWVQTASLSTGDYKKARIYVFKNGAANSPAYFEAASAGDPTDVFTPSGTGNSWSFKVATQNSSGYSVASALSDAATLVSGKAGVVEAASVETVHGLDFGDGQIKVSWTDPTYLPSGSATKVKVEFKTVAQAWSSATAYVANYPSSHYLVVGSPSLVPGTEYNVRVSVSTDGSATYTYGSLLTLNATVIPLTKPAPGTNLVATPGDGQVALTWTAGLTGGTPITNHYVDYRLASTSSWTSATTVATNSTAASATITGLTNGSAYLFRVRAVNAEGEDDTGIATSASVTPNPQPGSPTSLIGSAANSAVDLGWTAPVAAELHDQVITDYKIEYKASTSNTWKVFAHTASVTPSVRVTGLANGVAYNFRVSTKTAIGFSVPAVAASTVTPTNALGTPALTQFAVSVGAGSVSILDNQISQIATVVPSSSSGSFGVNGVGITSSFKSLDALGFSLPLNSLNQLVVYPGNKVSVSSSGFKPGTRVRLYIVGNNTSIGTAVANATGTVSVTGSIPTTQALGALVIQLNGSSSLNNLLSISVGANVPSALIATKLSVKFSVGSTTLSSAEKHKLRELVNATSSTPLALRVVANTFGKATTADKARATARAKAVAKYLKSLGVAATFTTVKNTGKAKSISSARNVVVTVEKPAL